MKKSILLGICAIALYSCSKSNEEVAKDKIEELGFKYDKIETKKLSEYQIWGTVLDAEGKRAQSLWNESLETIELPSTQREASKIFKQMLAIDYCVNNNLPKKSKNQSVDLFIFKSTEGEKFIPVVNNHISLHLYELCNDGYLVMRGLL